MNAEGPSEALPRLRTRNLLKNFGATAALRGVSFEIRPGEVHALIGENGAGKSTLMKILSGACRPDLGSMELDGKPFAPRNPSEALRDGIGMIYQELNLAPHLNILENITLGGEIHTAGWIRGKPLAEQARAILRDLGHEQLPLDAPVLSCSIAEKQVVEIARALFHHPAVLIMDEPTSSLSRSDTESLFTVVRRLRDKGVGIVYISHFLEECQEIADRYTVLRDGESVASGVMKETTLPEIIQMMVGRRIEEVYTRPSSTLGGSLLEITNLSGIKKPRQVSLTLREGEIHGVAGLVGSGRTEMVRACFGLDRLAEGKVVVAGSRLQPSRPDLSLARGLGFLSEDRKEEGLMLSRPLSENLALPSLKRGSRFGWVSNRDLQSRATHWISRLNIRCQSAEQTPAELSGGNQQKIALARLLDHGASILLLDEPTRGIDVGSKTEIYRLMGELAGQGKALLFVSSYLPELLGMCHRISVLYRGQLVETREAGDWTETALIAAAMGQAQTPAAV